MRRSIGFTFVELVVVMAIIAILTAIAVPNFLEAQVRGSVARSKAELALLNSAINSYRLDQKVYPQNAQAGYADVWSLTCLTTPVAYLTRLQMDALTTQEARGIHHVGGVAPTPYRYYNALQAAPKEGLQFSPPEGKVFFPGYVAGLVWGYGPASAMPPDPPRPVTAIDTKGVANLTLYDPTNGTTSRGDIYQVFP